MVKINGIAVYVHLFSKVIMWFCFSHNSEKFQMRASLLWNEQIYMSSKYFLKIYQTSFYKLLSFFILQTKKSVHVFAETVLFFYQINSANSDFTLISFIAELTVFFTFSSFDSMYPLRSVSYFRQACGRSVMLLLSKNIMTKKNAHLTLQMVELLWFTAKRD